MTRISIGDLSFNTRDFSENVQAAVDLLLEAYLSEKIGTDVLCLSTKHPGVASPLREKQDIFGNHGYMIMDDLKDLDVYIQPTKNEIPVFDPGPLDNSDLDSYVPRQCFNSFLWIDPKIIHEMMCIIAGYRYIYFYRKCFMHLKTYSNLRFAK